MSLTRRKGYTLVELTLVIVLLGIIASLGAAFFVPIVRLYFFTPTELRNEYVANRIVETIIEGDSEIKGLRIIKNIVSASDASISYVDADNVSASITWNSGTKKIRRTISPPPQTLPIEAPTHDTLIIGTTAGVIFKYYDSSGLPISTPVATPADIARIQLDWIAYTGSGGVLSAQGYYLIHSGVFVKQ